MGATAQGFFGLLCCFGLREGRGDAQLSCHFHDPFACDDDQADCHFQAQGEGEGTICKLFVLDYVVKLL